MLFKILLMIFRFNIFTASNICTSLSETLGTSKNSSQFSTSTFSFTRFIDLSYQEVEDVSLGGIIKL